MAAAVAAVATLTISCTTAQQGRAPSGEPVGSSSAKATAAASAPPARPADPATSRSAPAAPDCGDDQAGRYTDEILEAAPTVTVEYAPGLLADVYLPLDDPASCRAGIVWIHGGGFTQGTRDGGSELAWGEALARRGFVVASIDYRLGTEGGYGIDQATSPERKQVVADAIADGAAALGWLRGPAGSDVSAAGNADLLVDSARVAVGGTSAGAMTALGVGLTVPPGDRPCGMVSIAGDLDPGWVAADASARPPAALLVHGTSDILVPYRNAMDARDLLAAAGGDVTVDTRDGAGHELAGVPPDGVVAATADWLATHVAAGCR